MRRNHTRLRSVTRGFTLVEMAVVLFIFGLLIAGLLGPLETQLEARDRRQTIDTMDEVLEALYGFALTNGYLPCPDSDGDGQPDMTTEPYSPTDADTADCDGGGTFTDGEGFVPWALLNVPAGDAWGNRFRYVVRFPQFTMEEGDGICDGDNSTAPEAPEFDLCATGNIVVTTRGDNPATGGATEGKFVSNIANSLPAVLISHGRNGFGATAVTGAVRPTPPGSTDEEENTNGDTIFHSRSYSGERSACADDTDESSALCGFDDIVKWMSPALLNNRMVTAGRLP